ncbi:unnamed protein product [Pleuronectes platessa]|uniref:Uncharacterized protein n=1 Tax=Pleuronectes platessa TaxID=8262 RepID=A0A9N7TP02_PLEPL|nr:unnamed protein product [Pleuronectes platessa]
MAAGYVRALRSTLKGLHLDPGRRLLTHSSRTRALLCPCALPPATRCRLLRVSPAASLSSSSRTEPQSSSPTEGRRAGEEEEEDEGPEDIPHRRAKNPMVNIGYAWMIGLPTGIISFILAKREVDKNRLKQLKVRQRMRMSNDGEYEGSRYHRHSEGVNVDQ